MAGACTVRFGLETEVWEAEWGYEAGDERTGGLSGTGVAWSCSRPDGSAAVVLIGRSCRLCGEDHSCEDGIHDVWLGDDGDDAQASAARACEDISSPNTPMEVCP